MKEQIEQLKQFQTSFNSIINDTPTLLDEADYKLRAELSAEELDEYVQACKAGDLVEIADAITDRLFLVLGDAVAHGMGDVLPKLFEEVVASNMSKLDDDGYPIINGQGGVDDPTKPVGKILKSKNFFEPNLKKILDEQKDYNM